MILALHRVIRWEGPESNEEVAERTFVNRWTPPTPPGIPRRLARRFFGLPPA